MTPLAQFLEKTHAGHCEYYATATTLLLRAAGVPARYATGYAVKEYSALEGFYVARERHAHAWARAWIDGRWRDVDTTPPQWVLLEQESAPAWAPLANLWSFLRFRLNLLLERFGAAELYGLGAAVALLVVAPFAWKRLRGRWPRAAQGAARSGLQGERRGLDSEFFAVERRIAELAAPRGQAETMGEWLGRLAGDWDTGLLAELARLHRRHRFDPAGLDAAERERLREGAEAWLARFSSR